MANSVNRVLLFGINRIMRWYRHDGGHIVVSFSLLVCTVCSIRTNDASRGHVNTRAWVMGLYLANGPLCDPFTTVQL